MSDIRVCDGPGCSRGLALHGIFIGDLGDRSGRPEAWIEVDVPGRIQGPLTFHDEQCLANYYREKTTT